MGEEKTSYIHVRGGRENNLQNVNVSIPKHSLTVVSGVSGSGKSSLVFDTIAAESTRLMNETYPRFVQSFLPMRSRPDVDYLSGLTACIAISQEKIGESPRSTLATATDVHALLRMLFSKLGRPYWGPPSAFSFNIPTTQGSGRVTQTKNGRKVSEARTYTQLGGQCERCEGFGEIKDIDPHRVLDFSLSLNDGAITVPGYKVGGWAWRQYAESGEFDPEMKINDYPKKLLDKLLYAPAHKREIAGINMTIEGLIPKIRSSFLSKAPEAMQPHIRNFVEEAVTYAQCPQCQGTRLNEGARSSKIAGLSLADVCDKEIHDLIPWLDDVEKEGEKRKENTENISQQSAAERSTAQAESVRLMCGQLREIFRAFIDIGLGYLSFSRSTATLSGGESQRATLVRYLGSPLSDMTYVFDEPSAGLHPRDVEKVNLILQRLRDNGNTVIVVEHKPEIITAADYIIDMGPGAGIHGGKVCFEGSVAELEKSDTLTATSLRTRKITRERTRPSEFFSAHVNAHNVKNLDVKVPLKVLTVVTGVAGSGKSTLIREAFSPSVLKEFEGIYVDQSPIRGSSRSSVASYSGVGEAVRSLYALTFGVKPSLFSANSEGGCPACAGTGKITIELSPVEKLTRVCDTCGGKKFGEHVADYVIDGKDVSALMNTSVEEAAAFLHQQHAHAAKKIQKKIDPALPILENCVAVGLGYVTLGQSVADLSGGERQRLKVAMHLQESPSLIVLDEPTTGLHLSDVQKLADFLLSRVAEGASVVVVDHHPLLMAHADWIIDMGPGGGSAGGTIVAQGTPEEICAHGKGYTAAYVKEWLA